ncbi:MAG: lipocalin family protein, partial [Bacteroidota bacterium]
AGLTLFPACGDDDGGPDSLSGELTLAAGWGLQSFESNLAEKVAPIVDGLTADQLLLIEATPAELKEELEGLAQVFDLSLPACSKNDAAIFNADGTISANFSDDCGPDVDFELPNPLAPNADDNETSTYVRNNQNLTITIMGSFFGDTYTEVEAYEIVELTSSSLKLRLTDDALLDLLLEDDIPDIGAVDLQGWYVQFNFTAL